MRILRHLVVGGLSIAGLALASPALAVTTNLAYSFNLSNNNLTLATSTNSGNSMTFTQTVSGKTLTLTATAWNATIDSRTTITDTRTTVPDTRTTIIDTNKYITVGGVKKTNPNYNKSIPNPNLGGTMANPNLGGSMANPNAGKYVIAKSTLGEYAGGLGVTSANDDLTKSGCGVADCMTHQVDNFGNAAKSSSIDFIKLEFSSAVTLGQIQQSAFASYNQTETSQDINDDDFSYGKGYSSWASDGRAWTASEFAGIMPNNVNNGGASGGECSVTTWKPSNVTLTGCNDTRVLTSNTDATEATSSTTWFIAASLLTGKDKNGNTIYGNDLNPDSFKLASLTAYFTPPKPYVPALPEPSSWMTMIAGFGVAGTAIRRSRRQKNATVAA